MKTRSNWLVLLIAAALAAGLCWACGDDDDGATDAGTSDTDTDTDSDTDTDTDTDSDTEVTYDGTLTAQVMGMGVTAYIIVSSDLSITVGMRYICTDGNCNNIAIDAVRIYIGEDTEPFWEGETSDFNYVDAPFDGIAMENIPEDVSYEYANTVQEGFDDHCNELFTGEVDVSYNLGETLDTLTWSGDSVMVICINE
jgi:hypothetical protein